LRLRTINQIASIDNHKAVLALRSVRTALFIGEYGGNVYYVGIESGD